MKLQSILIILLSCTSISMAYVEDSISHFYKIAKQECDDIDSIHTEIDKINEEITSLLAKRTAYVKRAGDLKAQTIKIADDKQRALDQEQKIIAKSIKLELPTEISIPCFRVIMGTSTEFQQAYIDHLQSQDHFGL